MQILSSLTPIFVVLASWKYVIMILLGVIAEGVGIPLIVRYIRALQGKNVRTFSGKSYSPKTTKFVLGNILCALGISLISIGLYTVCRWSFRIEAVFDYLAG